MQTLQITPLFREKAWQKALLGTMNSGRSLYTPAGGKHALLTRRLRLRRGTMHGFVGTDLSGTALTAAVLVKSAGGQVSDTLSLYEVPGLRPCASGNRAG